LLHSLLVMTGFKDNLVLDLVFADNR